MRRIVAWALALAAVSGAALAQGGFEQSGLVGKLEAPAIVADPARMPKAFKEAPMLAEQVKAGKLPTVGERLGAEPMVVQPLRSIGKHGGTWRRGFLGPADGENGNRIRAGDKLLFWNAAGTEVAPQVAKGYELSADGDRKSTRLNSRH